MISLWIAVVLLSIIPFMACTYIVQRETHKRRESTLTVPCKYQSFFSYSCIVLGPIVVLVGSLQYLSRICYALRNITVLVASLQFYALECFQLCRLYYCFSAEKVHSDKGYPKWIFIIIFSLMSLLILYIMCVIPLFYGVTTRCGIRPNGDSFHVDYVLLQPSEHFIEIFVVPASVFTIDLTIVLLYWFKTKSFNCYEDEQHRAVYVRIQMILHRVLILTYFYVIVVCCLFFTVMPFLIFGNLSLQHVGAPIYSYAVYLMQDHNTAEYVDFLRILNKYKLYFCCCCCCGMVRDQYQMTVDNMSKKESEVPKKKTVLTLATLDNYVISDGMQYSNKATGMEMSVATKTEIHGAHSGANSIVMCQKLSNQSSTI